LTSRNIKGDELEKSGNGSPRKRMGIRLGNQFKPMDTLHLQEISNILGGREFCVMTGNNEISKSDLEIKVQEHGGAIVQNPGIL